MRLSIIPVAAALVVPMGTLPATAASPQDTPLQLTLNSADQNDILNQPTLAQASDSYGSTPAPVPNYQGSGFIANWMNIANQAQAMQPHWMTPVVTVTPLLVQEVRYDQFWQYRGNGQQQNVFDGGKGLEIIPTLTNEILINPPAYQERVNTRRPVSGWLDDQFLVIKQRLLSANEQEGNYAVTAFLGVTAGSGNAAFTNDAWTITPTISAGKGWGDFDIQATMGYGFMTRNVSSIGDTLTTNIAFQYHFLQYFWPEFELNDTLWTTGKQRGGKNQLFLTPGIVFGRFEIKDRIKAIVGVGYQIAVSPTYTAVPVLTPVYNHALILTTRLTF